MIMPAHEPYIGRPDAAAAPQRVDQPEVDGELAHRGRLATGDHQGVDERQLFGGAHPRGPDAARLQDLLVLAHITLQGEDSDQRRVSGNRCRHQPRPA